MSILAELIRERRGGRRAEAGAAPPTPEAGPSVGEAPPASAARAEATAATGESPEFAVSPVDGELVRIAGALHFADYRGTRYYFSCPNCKRRFLKEPERYLSASSPGA